MGSAVGVLSLPAVVPLLATKAAMSTWRPSMCRSRMQPMKSLWDTGKFSGRLGTPPRSSGPVRSRDLRGGIWVTGGTESEGD